MHDTYLYGPVASRRLGHSLGVDIVPVKTCTLDCIYCQLGKTTEKKPARKNYVPVNAVLAALKARIAGGLEADYITISGSGEPTLNSGLSEFIEGIRKITNIPVAILTNGTLLYEPLVRSACCKADVVLPSLDAGDERTFRTINRPHKDITLQKLVEGLIMFRNEFAGRIWLEVLLIEGTNTDIEQIRKIAALVERIRPDKVQLNTPVRPTAQAGLNPVSPEKLAQIASQLGWNVEVVADFEHIRHGTRFDIEQQTVLAMLKRRPCTLNDICSGLGIGPSHALKHITRLQKHGSIETEQRGQRTFFKAK